jgi:hypothetical protein
MSAASKTVDLMLQTHANERTTAATLHDLSLISASKHLGLLPQLKSHLDAWNELRTPLHSVSSNLDIVSSLAVWMFVFPIHAVRCVVSWDRQGVTCEAYETDEFQLRRARRDAERLLCDAASMARC